MTVSLFNKIMRLASGGNLDRHYWHDGYFVRIFDEEYGVGWQIYHNHLFEGLVDGGVAESGREAERSAEEYIENCLKYQTYLRS